MHESADDSKDPPAQPERHIVFFGETGSGKSSVVNLLLGVDDARDSNNSWPRTQATSNTCYETSLHDHTYCLWDTRDLGEGSSFFRAFLGEGSEKALKKFLKERHNRGEIDLLVYCVHGSRATKSLVRTYKKFCAISRRLAAPVAIVVTNLEKEKNIEDWWNRNDSALRMLRMDFDHHACITTVSGRHLAESKRKLVDLITRNYHWEPKESGSYFGSPVQISTQSAPPHHEEWVVWKYLKSTYKDNTVNKKLHLRLKISSDPSTTAPSLRNSVYYSAESGTESTPPTPTVEPPTPRSITTSSVNVPPIASFLGVNKLSQPSSEDISSIESSPRSMFHNSSHSSRTSNTESFIDGNEDCLRDLLVEDLTGKVTREINFPTQRGVFGDVWECNLASGTTSLKVAVKAIRTIPEEQARHRKKLYKELRIWWGLRHRNIVPLLGVVSDFGLLPSMVSPWFSNGSLSNYLIAHHKSSVLERRYLLRDISAGLSYLHSREIVHGDLHSGNVLIDDDGAARLTDFGVSLVNEFISTTYLTSSICGGVPFVDPALVKRTYDSPDMFQPTKPCDVYSFGGLMLHVLSGKKPYDEIRSASILLAVIRGERPQIPTDITPQDELIIQSCWDHEECSRPSADNLVRMFDEQQMPS